MLPRWVGRTTYMSKFRNMNSGGGRLMHTSCLPLNQPIPQGRTAARKSEVNGAAYLRDGVCYRRSGPMNYRSVRVKWAVYVSVSAVDTKEAWQTCPLSADGGIHNSIWRQFHAVSLPPSSLFPETDKEDLATEKRERGATTSCLPH